MKHFLLFLLLVVAEGHCVLTDLLPTLEDKIPIHSISGVDYIYVINLDHRKEKYRLTLEQLAPYGIVPYRLSGVNGWKLPFKTIQEVGLVFQAGMRPGGMGSVYRMDQGKEYVSHEVVEAEGTQYYCHCLARGAVGCVLSHLTALKDAQSAGYDVIWICEDDIEVMRDPHILSQYIEDLNRLEGKDHWDVLFTFRDYRVANGQYATPYGAAYRPNIDTRNQEKFNIDRPISPDLRQVGTRFGTQSMIWSKRGIEKILNFYNEHKIFLPYDLDLVTIPDIKMYSVIEDVVTNLLNPQSDLGSNGERL